MEKNCLPWSKKYFEETLVNKPFDVEPYTLTIQSIDSVTGDCDVTQRKGKVKCLFDMALKFSFQTTDDSDVSGTIEVAEFVHDQDESELIITVSSDTLPVEAKKPFIAGLKQTLLQFQPELIKAHEQDIKHNSETS